MADFDGVLYHISNPEGEGNENKVMVSIGLPSPMYTQVQAHGVDEMMTSIYGALVQPEAESNYDISLLIDLATVGADADDLVEKISAFKRNCFAAVFEKYFQLQRDGGAGVDGTPAIINYRPQETMYVSAHRDRVTVVFSVLFSDDDDVILGKVFLQEFKEARKMNQSAPQVLFSHKDPPAEITDSSALTGDNVGYVTFVLFTRHIDPKQSANTIDLIHTFRDYLHYHLKCSKAYLHTRMRAQASSLLKILNRAKPENVNKEKKTMSGKSFIRK